MNSIRLGDSADLQLNLANRHGLVTGATGTGKTVTLQKLAEGFSAAGVPVFAADIKGDLSGVSSGFPVTFWDLFEDDGLPIKTSIHEMGPQVLSRLLALNQTQEGVMNVAYRWLDDPEFPLYGCRMLDMDDLRASVTSLLDYAEDLRLRHGNVTAASIGAIQRALLILEGQGGDTLFGEPAFNVLDMVRTADDGRGVINLLSADRLMSSPRLYGAFLLWLLLSLFEALPEAGDLDRPKFVMIFDEAHLLFDEAPKPLLDTIERTVRLIRSKGVGVYFVTQSPLDVPPSVLAQLGNRVQHALRAFTPKDRRTVKAAADAFRQRPGLDTETAITQLGVGEALVSFLEPGGVPAMVQRVKIDLPEAQVGPIGHDERIAMIGRDPLLERYDVQFEDREAMHAAFMARIGAVEVKQKRATEGAKSWRRGSTSSSAGATTGSERKSYPDGSMPSV